VLACVPLPADALVDDVNERLGHSRIVA
jgi:hypothetical protein